MKLIKEDVEGDERLFDLDEVRVRWDGMVTLKE